VVVYWSGPEDNILEAFWVSTGLVALGEMGDKTQLLAMLLAARFKKPVPIMLGILLATLANHALAGALGGWIAAVLGPDVLRWVVGLSFIAMAVWMLIPDAIESDLAIRDVAAWGVLGTTFVAFFVAEMGDKTQIATVALAARYSDLLAVVAGSTAGMMLANVPAVYLGNRLSMAWVHGVSAVLFLALGVATLLNLGRLF
jgi:Ca2+/H+ antiporter, TMEM165/GDT1 family